MNTTTNTNTGHLVTVTNGVLNLFGPAGSGKTKALKALRNPRCADLYIEVDAEQLTPGFVGQLIASQAGKTVLVDGATEATGEALIRLRDGGLSVVAASREMLWAEAAMSEGGL